MDNPLNPSKNYDRRWLLLELPVTGYEEGLALQDTLVEAKKDGGLQEDVLVLLEHEPVFTLGNRGGRRYLKVPESFLRKRNVPLVRTGRGGFITYHGPGQLVAYPIIDLKRAKIAVKAYVELLEEVMIRTAADFGARTRRHEGNRGVWVGNKKIGSVGIRVKRNISMHGLALNVVPDLAPFSWIEPCGLHGVTMTSLTGETGEPIVIDAVRERMVAHFSSLFRVDLKKMAPADLMELLGRWEGSEVKLRKTGIG